ncbi:MAG: hypothetical protein KME27_20095 [Lyngbya sp. HA4199-MV5]|jgi:hypothetical protein|nr:hypothetical protein [Lyngbya sp. HA4199-MV5]
MDKPQATDGILGGQTPPPVNSATLGGIEGLQQRLAIAPSEERSHLLSTALSYGEAGIDLLIATLNNDSALTVRATAYQLLQSVDLEKAKTAIASGILLNPGDRVYSVYQSAISFDDEFFNLETNVFEECESFEDFIENVEWREMGYESYESFYEDHLDDYQSHVPQKKSRHLSRAVAEREADLLHQKLAWEWDEQEYTGSFDIPLTFHRNLQEWCAVNQVNCEKPFISTYTLSNWLKTSENRELFAKLWRDAVGKFAFVREEAVNEPQYLKL